jgi:hypothetical protein
MNGWETIEGYLLATLGERPTMRPMAVEATRRLPLVLRNRYEIATATVLGRPLFLAMDRHKEAAVPAEYVGHLNMLHETLGPDVVLVLHALPGQRRARLVQAGVPFIVPGRQLFLPMLATDMRERTARTRRAKAGALTLAAQVVVLRHLLGYETAGRSLRALAVDLDYSAMTLSNVAEELAANELCRVATKGRSRILEFKGTKRELWDRSQALMRSPVRQVRSVRMPDARAAREWKLAGFSALAKLTLLADDAHPTYALCNRGLAQVLVEGKVIEAPDAEMATASLETWGYDPLLLTAGPTVDRLSLYLSLRGTADERVDKALREDFSFREIFGS